MTKLNSLLSKRALSKPTPSNQMPIPDQYLGIEIELESLHDTVLSRHIQVGEPYWSHHIDGSLRNGLEFTLTNPLMGEQLVEAIDHFATLGEYTGSWTCGPRTSTHIHLNMLQDSDTYELLRALLIAYYCIEDAWFKQFANGREWCSYCDPLDSGFIQTISQLLNKSASATDWARYVASEGSRRSNNASRYYGFNLIALAKYGTVEFRHFPGLPAGPALRSVLFEWVRAVMLLKKAAMRLENYSIDQLTPSMVYSACFEELPWIANHTSEEQVATRLATLQVEASVSELAKPDRRAYVRSNLVRSFLGIPEASTAKKPVKKPAKRAAPETSPLPPEPSSDQRVADIVRRYQEHINRTRVSFGALPQSNHSLLEVDPDYYRITTTSATSSEEPR